MKIIVVPALQSKFNRTAHPAMVPQRHQNYCILTSSLSLSSSELQPDHLISQNPPFAQEFIALASCSNILFVEHSRILSFLNLIYPLLYTKINCCACLQKQLRSSFPSAQTHSNLPFFVVYSPMLTYLSRDTEEPEIITSQAGVGELSLVCQSCFK